ncbi:MAG: Na+/H+ antiporter NhaC [Bacteroidetes bacterium]|nr:Na+/H+ antiporter NhaC [Bacteroidota bacterium]
MEHKAKDASLTASLIPIVFLITFLSLNVMIFGDDTLSGSNQIILLMAASIASLIAYINGYSWEHILQSILKSIHTAMPAILILLVIGSLAGTWMISGVVPAMIYYGLEIIHPSIFLGTALVVSGIVSLATGSSWSTIATIGVALFGIGHTLGIHEGMVAGAIISGAYFGDKMSPLSDTTNLAPAVAGTGLFTHIRYMMYTTVPAILLAFIIFIILGFTIDFSAQSLGIAEVQSAIRSNFNINPWLLIVPAVLIVLIMKKISPLPALFIGTLSGALFAFIFQGDLIHELKGQTVGGGFQNTYRILMESMFGTLNFGTQHPVIDRLFSTSGMAGMLNTVWLILTAMVFGGSMDAGGQLRTISHAIIQKARSGGSLIGSTVFTCLFFNATASDQYMAIVVPGRMFSDTFRQRGYKPEVLSRTLEDAGTVTSVLIPWNTGGATQAKVLGVSTWTYLPYCFFNILSPVIAIMLAYANYKIRRNNKEDA